MLLATAYKQDLHHSGANLSPQGTKWSLATLSCCLLLRQTEVFTSGSKLREGSINAVYHGLVKHILGSSFTFVELLGKMRTQEHVIIQSVTALPPPACDLHGDALASLLRRCALRSPKLRHNELNVLLIDDAFSIAETSSLPIH